MCRECEARAMEAAKGLGDHVPGAIVDEAAVAEELYRKELKRCPKRVGTYEELAKLHGCKSLMKLKPEEDGTDCCCGAQLDQSLTPNCRVNNPCDLLRLLCYCPDYEGFWRKEIQGESYVLVDTRNPADA